MRRLITIVSITVLSCSTFGQLPVRVPSQDQNDLKDSITEKKISYSFSTGAALMTAPGAGRGSVFFFSPEITYRFSPKFTMNAGLIVNQNNYSLPIAYIGDNQSVVVKSTPVANQNIFYSSGNYAVSPRLLITGSIMTTLSPGTSENASQSAWQNSFQVMSMGMSYKLSENIMFSAGMRMVRSNGLNMLSGSYNSLNSYEMGTNPLGL